ncbi:MAG TPA: D-glycero-beta-D-manno-heptose-7-phosphate kinase [Verrucomicrobiales bacterium]|nr:D-glycero-beta-D-manno-heptose-7-phosphate kinase [Verrucomicrobiales bacterium]
MNQNTLPVSRVRELLAEGARQQILVLGDFMLDQFVWGRVNRISPEAPVPVLEFQRESYMPGGAANVARNLAALKNSAAMIGPLGRDHAGAKLKELLTKAGVGCRGLFSQSKRPTSIKTRIVAHQQQIVRVDREEREAIDVETVERILGAVEKQINRTAAIILGDYGKGGVTQPLLDGLKKLCRQHGVWISLDPKPVHKVDISGMSLITPNRKEAFELAGIEDERRGDHPLEDKSLMQVARTLQRRLKPALMLITLGDQGMLLCHSGDKPFHVPTTAQEVFDVSGAGDTVIASFTLAIAAGASPVEAAIFSNHAAGVVVGKVGTATVSPKELLASFAR